MNKSIVWWSFFGVAIIGIDRLTKWYALAHCFMSPWNLTSFFSCDVSFNRGISWGLFYTSNTLFFGLMSWFIVLVTLAMAVWATMRYLQGYSIIGEICVIAGSLANIADRFIYHGVIDFIVVHYKKWAWPAFNIADISIVIGIFLMLLTYICSSISLGETQNGEQ
jgi:signal peptidase II